MADGKYEVNLALTPLLVVMAEFRSIGIGDYELNGGFNWVCVFGLLSVGGGGVGGGYLFLLPE